MLKTLLIVCLAQLTILFSAEGVSMSITPSSMVVGSSLADVVLRFELRCSSDGTSNITGVYSLQISRRKFADTGYTGIALLDPYEGSKLDPSIPADIMAKSPNITGGLVGNPPTSGTLTVTIGVGGLTCKDQAEFKCEMTYRATGGSGIATASAHNYFTVLTAPNDVRITDALYEEDGIQLHLTNDSRLNEGTRIMYRCTASIGDNPNVAILWERSSMTGTSTDFITYTPTVSTDIVQDSVSQAICSYSQTSSMYYNMTHLDDNGITFRCKVRAYVGGRWYESMSAHHRSYSVSTPSSTSSVITTSLITYSTSSNSTSPTNSINKVSVSGFNLTWAGEPPIYDINVSCTLMQSNVSLSNKDYALNYANGIMVVIVSLYQSIYRRFADG